MTKTGENSNNTRGWINIFWSVVVSVALIGIAWGALSTSVRETRKHLEIHCVESKEWTDKVQLNREAIIEIKSDLKHLNDVANQNYQLLLQINRKLENSP